MVTCIHMEVEEAICKHMEEEVVTYTYMEEVEVTCTCTEEDSATYNNKEVVSPGSRAVVHCKAHHRQLRC